MFNICKIYKYAILIFICFLIIFTPVFGEYTSNNFFYDGTPSLGIYQRQFLKSYVNIDPQLTKGYNYLVEFKFNEAVNILTKLVKNKAKPAGIRSEAFALLGYSYLNLYKLDKAKKSLNESIKINKKNALAYFFLANIYYLNNDFTQTKKYLSLAVKYKPNFVAALRMLAETYKDEDELDKAAQCYKNIINLLPKSGYYLYQYYKVSNMNKNYKEVVSTLKFMKQLQPNFILNNIRLGDAYTKMGNYNKAKREYLDVLKRNPKCTKAYEGLSNVSIAQGDYDKAMEFANKAKEIEPDNPFVKSLLIDIENKKAEKRQNVALATFFSIMGIAVMIALIYFVMSYRRNQYILSVIKKFNKSIDNIYDQDSLIAFLLDFFKELGGASKGIFLQFNRQNNQLSAKDCMGIKKQEINNMSLYAGEEITNWLTELKRYLLSINDIEKDPMFEEVFPSLKDRLKEMSLKYVFPLREKNSFVGFIALNELKLKDRILPNEHDLLMSLSTTSAQGMTNLTLYETSITDETMGLYNKRHFWQNLSSEIKRSKRYGQPVSLLTCDIDNFKKLNDTFGHPQGDRVLRDLGAIVIKTFREGIDIGARIGGEEFAVILPSTAAEQAKLAAERLRKALHNHKFEGFPETSNYKVTISMGVATFPTHSDSAKELVQKSDESLYHAKRTGKDKVCVYGHLKEKSNIVEEPQKATKRTPESLLDISGLFSRAFFDERFFGEVRRSERSSRPCSILLISPDNKQDASKRLNLLKDISSILHSNLRKGIDVPARFEEEIISILIPETDHHRAAQIARRIKKLLDNKKYSDNNKVITFSIGVSNYPHFGKTQESLMESAKQALKMCRQMGGNRALIATPIS